MVSPNQNVYAWIALGISSCLALGLIFYSNQIFYQDFLSTSLTYGSSPMPKRPPHAKEIVEIDFGPKDLRIFESDTTSSYELERALDAVGQAGQFKFSIRTGKIYSVAGKSGVWTSIKTVLSSTSQFQISL
ncbi:MAG: hypothetical protein HYW91_01085 [Candidatus Sungbacteria bacterium]|nr:hypothetical protein [Candidatus Sungbacteria bacterium]